MATSPAGRMLSRQLQQMQSDKDIPGISCGLVDNNVFEWEVMLMISDDVKLYGGMFKLPWLSFGATNHSFQGLAWFSVLSFCVCYLGSLWRVYANIYIFI